MIGDNKFCIPGKKLRNQSTGKREQEKRHLIRWKTKVKKS